MTKLEKTICEETLNYKKIDFTGLLMKFIDANIDINVVCKKLNWFEFDNKEDFVIYENL